MYFSCGQTSYHPYNNCTRVVHEPWFHLEMISINRNPLCCPSPFTWKSHPPCCPSPKSNSELKAKSSSSSLQPYPRAQVCRRRHFGSFPGSHGLLLVNSHKIIPELRHPYRSFLSSHYHYITNSLTSFTSAFGSAVEAETTLPQPLRIPLVTRQVAYTQSKSSISLLASS